MAEQLDLFVALPSAELPIKSQQDLMGRSWFSLSKQKRSKTIEHKFGEDVVRISAGKHGMATIWDYDFILFAVSQVMEMVNSGVIEPGKLYSPSLQFRPYDFLKWSGVARPSGKHYQELEATLQRLHTTQVETTLHQTDKKNVYQSFYWVPSWRVEKRGDKVEGIRVGLPEWLWTAIVEKRLVLTLDKEYFSISSGLERWIYLYIRKSAGFQKDGWEERLSLIYEKSGAIEPYRNFKVRIRKIIENQSIPHYQISQREHGRETILVVKRALARLPVD